MISSNHTTRRTWVRPLAWGAAASLLLVPLVAMQFTDEVAWTASDFLIAGLMLGSVGVAFELVVRASGDTMYRIGAALGLAAGFLLVWVNGAVGFLGDEGNPANLMFGGVLAVALGGAIIARFRAAGMAWAMVAATAAQIVVALIAAAFRLNSPGLIGEYEVVVGTGLFAAIWLLSAACFRAAHDAAANAAR